MNNLPPRAARRPFGCRQTAMRRASGWRFGVSSTAGSYCDWKWNRWPTRRSPPTWPSRCCPASVSRPAPLHWFASAAPASFSMGDDGLLLQIASLGGIGSQLGREVTLEPGDAILFSNSDIGGFTFPGVTDAVALRLPCSALLPLLRAGDDVLLRRIPKRAPALQLLVNYLSNMREALANAGPELQQLVVDHIRDLLALALGATRDAREIANGRGVRAARLRALKAYIGQNLERPELSLDRAANAIGVTPRYVQMPFAAEDTTFSRHVLSERLTRVYRLLTNPAFAERSVADLAFEVGSATCPISTARSAGITVQPPRTSEPEQPVVKTGEKIGFLVGCREQARRRGVAEGMSVKQAVYSRR